MIEFDNLDLVLNKAWNNNKKQVYCFKWYKYIKNDSKVHYNDYIESAKEINEIDLYEYFMSILNMFNFANSNIWCIRTLGGEIILWVASKINKNYHCLKYYNNSNALMYEIFPSVYAMCETMLYNAEEKDASGIIYKAKPFSLRNVLVNKYIEEKFNSSSEVGYIKNGNINLFDSMMLEFMSQPGGIPPMGANDAMMVQYGYNNTFTGNQSAGETDKLVKLSTGENNTDKKKKNSEVDRFFNVYAYTGKKHKKKDDDATLYESLCGRKMLSPDQVEYDKDFRLVQYNGDQTFRSLLSNIVKECECEIDPNNLPVDYLPLISISDKNAAKCKLVNLPNCEILTDNDGYFILNTASGKRSASVETIDLLDPNVVLEQEKFNSIKDEIEYFNSAPGQMVIYDPKNLDDLEDQYNKFYSMPDDERRISNDKSIAIFGKNNETRYREMKSKFLNAKLPSYDKYTNLVESGKFNILSLDNIEKAKDEQISLNDAEFKFKGLKEWSFNSGIYIMVPCEDLTQLNDLYNKFSSMPKILKKMSDWKLMESIGCNNETFYQFQKSIMENNSSKNFYPLPLIESVIEENVEQFPSTNLPLDIPFYSPYELNCFINNEPLASERIIDKNKIKQWYHEYRKIYNGNKFDRSKLIEWVDTVRNLSYKLKSASEKYRPAIQESLLELGWNPYLEFTVENRAKAYKRVKRIKVNEMIETMIHESKDLPIKFDNYGNLLITKPNDVDLDKEYFESHRLLLAYEENENIDGIKFELCRLWYLNNIAENRIYTSKLSAAEIKKINISRGRILNDFNKYIKVVLKKDKNFNFNNFYSKSKFDDKQIRVNRSTLKFSFSYLKQLLKHIL